MMPFIDDDVIGIGLDGYVCIPPTMAGFFSAQNLADQDRLGRFRSPGDTPEKIQCDEAGDESVFLTAVPFFAEAEIKRVRTSLAAG